MKRKSSFSFIVEEENKILNTLKEIKVCLEILTVQNLLEKEESEKEEKWQTLEKVLTRTIAVLYTVALTLLFTVYLLLVLA